MKKKFHLYLLVFFLPVILGYAVVEMASRNLLSGFRNISHYLEKNAQDIEVLALGSSQVKDAINPAWMESPGLNMASGDQHYDSDFKLYSSVKHRLPNLKTIILELSYSHFELPQNGTGFWKNSVYLEYYKANCFERSTWFKDRLIFLSNPQFYSSQIVNQYITKEVRSGYNQYGFDTLNFDGRFYNLNYNEARIEKTNFKINTVPNREIFKENTALFLDMLETMSSDGFNIIVVSVPMYKGYLPVRNPEILHRRDSMLKVISTRFKNVSILNHEEDTTNFRVYHYWNQSHLNPDGAKIFTDMLQQKLNSLN